MVRLGQCETADGFASTKQRQPLLLLRLASECKDGVHYQRALHRSETAQARISTLEFLHHQAISDIVDSGKAGRGKVCSEKA